MNGRESQGNLFPFPGDGNRLSCPQPENMGFLFLRPDFKREVPRRFPSRLRERSAFFFRSSDAAFPSISQDKGFGPGRIPECRIRMMAIGKAPFQTVFQKQIHFPVRLPGYGKRDRFLGSPRRASGRVDVFRTRPKKSVKDISRSKFSVLNPLLITRTVWSDG